jgi:hypothetical protein
LYLSFLFLVGEEEEEEEEEVGGGALGLTANLFPLNSCEDDCEGRVRVIGLLRAVLLLVVIEGVVVDLSRPNGGLMLLLLLGG